MVEDFCDARRLGEGLVDIVDGKVTISSAGKALWDNLLSTIPDIRVLNVKAIGRWSYGRLSAMTEVSINGDAINVNISFERDNISAPYFLEPHLAKVMAAVVDYVKRKKRVWEGKRFQRMINYDVIRNGKHSSPLGNVVLEMAKVMQAEYKANPPANQQHKINTDAVIQIVTPELHQDFKTCHYTQLSGIGDAANKQSENDYIKDEIDRFTDNNPLQRGFSPTYDIWSAIQDGKGDLKEFNYDDLWYTAINRLLDVYNGTITWKNTVLKELYEKHEQDIRDMFKDAKAWRLSYFNLNEVSVVFEHQTNYGDTLTIAYGPRYRLSQQNQEKLIKILKKYNLYME
jgi:hypothetical protein